MKPRFGFWLENILEKYFEEINVCIYLMRGSARSTHAVKEA